MFFPRNFGSALGRASAALLSVSRPILVQLVVTRRCNLSCGYCFEYDAASPPIETGRLLQCIDHAGRLGTIVLTLTGGEPLLHPDLDRLIARAHAHGMICTLITNGVSLTRPRIERLNDAGLAFLQVSVDSLEATSLSQKAWSRLRQPVQLLRAHARFGVNVNAVFGACDLQALERLAAEVREAGFYMTLGVMHGHDGGIVVSRGGTSDDDHQAGHEAAVRFERLQRSSRKTLFHRSGEGWELQLLRRGAAPFKCRAGARYLYVDETGRACYCSQRRDLPGIPFLDVDAHHLAREFHRPKHCAPSCAIGCARRASAFDEWRGQRG